MATARAQRIGIWIIAVVLTVGTIGGFFAIILSNQNTKNDQLSQQEQYEQYIKQQEEAAKASAAASEGFDGYSPRTFDADSVTELKTEILVEGSGQEISSTDSINASYFGWLADGTIFDSSKKKNVDDAPVTFPLSGVIKGWTEALSGKKVGSIVRLTIPADKAYGANGSGTIPANSPLEFIVKINSIDNAAAN